MERVILTEGDLLPMDSGEEAAVINEAYAWFVDKMPQDKINNNNDKS